MLLFVCSRRSSPRSCLSCRLPLPRQTRVPCSRILSSLSSLSSRSCNFQQSTLTPPFHYIIILPSAPSSRAVTLKDRCTATAADEDCVAAGNAKRAVDCQWVWRVQCVIMRKREREGGARTPVPLPASLTTLYGYERIYYFKEGESITHRTRSPIKSCGGKGSWKGLSRSGRMHCDESWRQQLPVTSDIMCPCVCTDRHFLFHVMIVKAAAEAADSAQQTAKVQLTLLPLPLDDVFADGQVAGVGM